MKGISFGILLLIVGGTCASTRVFPDDVLGVYVGAAIGESHVRTSKEIIGDTGYDYSFSEQHSAWKVTAGVRPISRFGVELGYIDFGNPSTGIRLEVWAGSAKQMQRPSRSSALVTCHSLSHF